MMNVIGLAYMRMGEGSSAGQMAGAPAPGTDVEAAAEQAAEIAGIHEAALPGDLAHLDGRQARVLQQLGGMLDRKSVV